MLHQHYSKVQAKRQKADLDLIDGGFADYLQRRHSSAFTIVIINLLALSETFLNNVWDMTIDVGTGNPGAEGIDWSCTADPSGNLDSTATIQQAVKDHIGNSPAVTLYFPAGTYKISSTINCVNSALYPDRPMAAESNPSQVNVYALREVLATAAATS